MVSWKYGFGVVRNGRRLVHEGVGHLGQECQPDSQGGMCV